jgi:predicted dithiol-disulfide oxidoreductase (DUF899 family)
MQEAYAAIITYQVCSELLGGHKGGRMRNRPLTMCAVARCNRYHPAGWEIPWDTITDSFDTDFGVDEWHGHNAFIRDGERVFRTYFINGRGDEAMGTT